MLGGEDVALVGSGADQRDRRGIRGVGELARPADVGDLLVGFSSPQARDEAGGVDEGGEAVEGGVELSAVRGDEAVALVLDAEALALEAEIRGEVAQVPRRLGVGPVRPDPDVLDQRGVLRLAQVGGAREEGHAAVGGDRQGTGRSRSRRCRSR